MSVMILIFFWWRGFTQSLHFVGLQVAVAVLNNGLRPEIPAWCPQYFAMLIQVIKTGYATVVFALYLVFACLLCLPKTDETEFPICFEIETDQNVRLLTFLRLLVHTFAYAKYGILACWSLVWVHAQL